MNRTQTSFSLLQAIAVVAILSVISWSIGLPLFRFAEAANVTTFSDTLSDSGPAVTANHTISFVTPTGVATGESVVIDFSDGPFVVGSVDYTDIDIATTSDYSLAADCTGSEQASAAFAGTTLTITFCATDGGSIPVNGTTTIQIGDNATFGTAGAEKLTNPAVGSYQIIITAGPADTGETRVAIVAPVVVTATVDTTFTFTVEGMPAGSTINGTSTTGSTTATAIPFGRLNPGVASTTAQQLSVITNARNGFVVTVQTDGDFLSTTGAEISSFIEGAHTPTPTVWQSPVPVIGQSNTYGHWGLTTNDETLGGGLTDVFLANGAGSNRYVAASTTAVEVFRNDGPADGTTTNKGRTQVGYRVEISTMQEAAEDYTATLTYVATPVF